MLQRLFWTLATCACCAFLLVACGQTPDANNASATNAVNAKADEAATAGNSNATASGVAASAEGADAKIGVPECDQYVAMYETCVSNNSGKLSPAMRARSEAALARMRKSWRDMAADPQKKASLPQACKSAIESARESLKSMGCEF